MSTATAMSRKKQQVAPATTRSNRMSLSSIRPSRKDTPDRILLVGTEGIGKSTFAADAPSPIFIASEDGLSKLDVSVFPEPEDYSGVLEAIETLRQDEHEFKTLVIDTLDWLEPLLWAELCIKHKWSNIEDPGYGRGYTFALDEWRTLLSRLDLLRSERQMEIILIAHAAIKTFNNPAGADYSRYECKLHRGAAALVKEWTDANLFAVHEEFSVMKKDKPTNKAVSTGRRIIHTERTAAWDAKNRHGLPPELPLNYEAYAEARTSGRPASTAALLAEIKDLFAYVPEDKREATEAFLETHKDNPTELAKALNRLRSLASQEGAE